MSKPPVHAQEVDIPTFIGRTRLSTGMQKLLDALQAEYGYEMKIASVSQHRLAISYNGKRAEIPSVITEKSAEQVASAFDTLGIDVNVIAAHAPRREDIPPKLFGIQLSIGSAWLLEQLSDSMAEDLKVQAIKVAEEQKGDTDWEKIATDLEEDLVKVRREKDNAINDMRRQIREAEARAEKAEADLRELRQAVAVIQRVQVD